VSDSAYASVVTFAEGYSATHSPTNTPADPGLPPGYITVVTIPGWVVVIADPFVNPVVEPDISIDTLAPPEPGDPLGLPTFGFFGYAVRGSEPAPVPVDFGVPPAPPAAPAPPAQPDPPTAPPNEFKPEVPNPTAVTSSDAPAANPDSDPATNPDGDSTSANPGGDGPSSGDGGGDGGGGE
jgi:hypothetical protein